MAEEGMVECSECGEEVDEDDVYECQTCKKTNLCEDCQVGCSECEDVMCDNCQIVFENADITLCKKCIDKVYAVKEVVKEKIVEKIVEVPKEVIKVMGFSEPIL